MEERVQEQHKKENLRTQTYMSRTRLTVGAAHRLSALLYYPAIEGLDSSDPTRLAMTRRGFHILLALTLLICVITPFAEEFALHLNQSIFASGYDSESTVAVIALILILAFALAKLLASFVPEWTTEQPLFHPQEIVSLGTDAAASVPDASPPLALRI